MSRIILFINFEKSLVIIIIILAHFCTIRVAYGSQSVHSVQHTHKEGRVVCRPTTPVIVAECRSTHYSGCKNVSWFYGAPGNEPLTFKLLETH